MPSTDNYSHRLPTGQTSSHATADAHPLSLLLVEDNPHHVELVRRRLDRSTAAPMQLSCAETLATALKRLSEGGIDAVLLDLVLPDSPIDQTLPSIFEAFPAVPVIVLTSLDDVEFAARTVQQGAQDYLVKSQLTGELLLRSVRYAVERKKSLEVLRQYASDLERSNEDLKRFAHTVAHEVKSPLGVVAGCVGLVGEEAHRLDPLARDLLSEADAAVRGLAELVDDLLRFASVERQRAGASPVDLEAVFYQAFVALRPEIKATGTRVTHDPLPTVVGDAVPLRHVLQNLLANAIKYRGHRTPEVHIGVEPEDAGAGETNWRIWVRDNGMGIATEHRDRVFEMFYRIHAPAGPAGTGIGLAFCRRVIEQHGGRLWLESEPSRGTTFHFTLPAADAALHPPRCAAAVPR